MTAFEQLNTLDNIVIQSGTYKELQLPCYYSDGEPMALSSMTYGCTLSLYGEDSVLLQNIVGTIKSGTENVMVISILSEYTEGMDNCVLMYRPYIIDGLKKYKFQGRLIIGASTPTA